MRRHLTILSLGLILTQFSFGQNICNSTQLILKNKVKSVAIYLVHPDTSKGSAERLFMIFNYDTLGRRISIDWYNTAEAKYTGTQRFFYRGNSFDGIKAQDISPNGQILEEKIASQNNIYDFNTDFYGAKNHSFILNDKELYSMFLIYTDTTTTKDRGLKTILRLDYYYY